MLDLQYILTHFAVLLLSLSVHEAAHAWTADRLGDPTARQLGRITLNPMAHIDWIGTVFFPLAAMLSGLPLLGWAKPVPVEWRNLRAPRRDFAVIAAAGPISNLVLAAIVAVVLFVMGGALNMEPSVFRTLAVDAVILNAVLAIFNLVPIPPLDGGNVATGLLPLPMARALAQVRPWGFLVLYALMFSGILSRFVFPIAYRIADWLLTGGTIG